MIAEYVNSQLNREYVWGSDPDELLQIKRDSDNNGSLDQTLYPILDDLNSVHTLTDASGQPVERYRYESDGRTFVQAPDSSPRTLSLFGNTIGWQGRPWVGGYGYFRNRWFDSETHTWLTPDPAHYSDDVANAYAPMGRDGGINIADPWGLWYQVSVRENFGYLTFRRLRDEDGSLYDSLKKHPATTIFIHGYNVDSEKANLWAADMESRLRGAGYDGSLIGFTWPGNYTPMNDDAGPGSSAGLYFNQDIQEARKSGYGLAHLIRFIRHNTTPGLKISLLSHSLGAEVLLAGLQLLAEARQQLVDTAIMTQAAVPPAYLLPRPFLELPMREPGRPLAIEADGTRRRLALWEDTSIQLHDYGRYVDAPQALNCTGGVPNLYSFYSGGDQTLADLYPLNGQPVALGLNFVKELGGLLPEFSRQINTTPGTFDSKCPKCGIGSHSAYRESSKALTQGVFRRLADYLNK